MSERRRNPRRALPFLRSVVLEYGDEPHIVLLLDLSAEGAFVTSRVTGGLPQPPPDRPLRLRMIAPRGSRDTAVPCEVVWRSERFDPVQGRPAGVALHFLKVDPELRRSIEAFARQGLGPSSSDDEALRYEYRIIERPNLEASELARFGHDGWQLVTLVPSHDGCKLIFVRRI
jgi:hypothetical protein